MIKPLLLSLFLALALFACGGTPPEASVDSTDQALEHRLTMIVKIGTTYPFPDYNMLRLSPDPSNTSEVVGMTFTTTSGPAHAAYDTTIHHAYFAELAAQQDTLVQDLDTPGVETSVTFTYTDCVTGQCAASGPKFHTSPIP